MTSENTASGCFMTAEAAQSMGVFVQAATQKVNNDVLGKPRAIYTIARGSSDAVANILSYEFMRELGVPVTSLPPSVFSIGAGVSLEEVIVLVISQSGASDDLVLSAKGASAQGATVVAITNQRDSSVELESNMTLSVCAGPELAVPATKSVMGSIGAGMALLGALKAGYAFKARAAADKLKDLSVQHPRVRALQSAFLRARHIYVIGRDTGYGAAQEVALKLKECCSLHAEAYSSSEVLHGPLQLATNPLMVLMLDTGIAEIQDSLDRAEAKFTAVDCDVHRIRISEFCCDEMAPAAAAAFLLATMYPVILKTALALGLDPDTPETLSKVTQTR
jgi:glutamine---fructose-6-phosphate transaminase (isomerizing)